MTTVEQAADKAALKYAKPLPSLLNSVAYGAFLSGASWEREHGKAQEQLKIAIEALDNAIDEECGCQWKVQLGKIRADECNLHIAVRAALQKLRAEVSK